MATNRYFGEYSRSPKGTHFSSRLKLSKAGIHRPTQAGISGSAHEGADSIVVSGGYIDDDDRGEYILYTGHGGQDEKGRQISDQNLDSYGNAALIKSAETKRPVRVIRGFKNPSKFAPIEGYRYDGLYFVEEYWTEDGQDGFRIIRFVLKSVTSKGSHPFKRKNVTQSSILDSESQTSDITTALNTIKSGKKTSQNFPPKSEEVPEDITTLIYSALQAENDNGLNVLGTRLHQRMRAFDPTFNFRENGFRTFKEFLQSRPEVDVVTKDATDILVSRKSLTHSSSRRETVKQENRSKRVRNTFIQKFRNRWNLGYLKKDVREITRAPKEDENELTSESPTIGRKSNQAWADSVTKHEENHPSSSPKSEQITHVPKLSVKVSDLPAWLMLSSQLSSRNRDFLMRHSEDKTIGDLRDNILDQSDREVTAFLNTEKRIADIMTNLLRTERDLERWISGDRFIRDISWVFDTESTDNKRNFIRVLSEENEVSETVLDALGSLKSETFNFLSSEAISLICRRPHLNFGDINQALQLFLNYLERDDYQYGYDVPVEILRNSAPISSLYRFNQTLEILDVSNRLYRVGLRHVGQLTCLNGMFVRCLREIGLDMALSTVHKVKIIRVRESADND